MEREIVNAGAKLSLSSLFEHLQDDVKLNTYRDFDQIIDTYGINCDTVSGLVPASDTTLKVTAAGAQIAINTGTGLTAAFNYIDVSTPDTSTPPGNNTYTVYIKYVENQDEQVDIINGFLYATGEPTVPSRGHADYEIVYDTDPGVSGLTLAEIVVSTGTVQSVTDLRHANVLKLKHCVFPDTVVKIDRDSDIAGKLTANYIGTKGPEGYEMLINTAGMTQDEELSASGIVQAHDYRHWHGNEVTQGSRTVLDSVSAITAHSELKAAFRYGVINFQEGNGDRWIVTKIIPSKPNTPTDLTIGLRELVPDDITTKALTNSIRSYTVKEISLAHNINANTALTDWRQSIVTYQTAHPTWGADELYAVSGLEATMSGLFNQGYAYDAGGIVPEENYDPEGLTALGWNETGGTITDVLEAIDLTLAFSDDAKSTLNSDMAIISKEILNKESEIKTHPDKGKRQFEALCKWTRPALVDLEPIVKYQLKIYKLTHTSTAVADGTPLTTLLSNYTAEIVKDINVESVAAGIRWTEKGNTTVKAGVTQTASKIYLNSTTGMDALDAINITVSGLGQYSAIIKTVSSDGDGVYIDLALPLTNSYNNEVIPLAEDTVLSYAEVVESLDQYWIDGVYKTTYAFPIDVDQYYIVYIRSVSKYGIVSDWSNGVKVTTNDLSSGGVTLANKSKEDKTFLAQAKEIERKEIKREFETQILALQQQVAALPTQDQVSNLSVELSSLDTRVGSLETPA